MNHAHNLLARSLAALALLALMQQPTLAQQPSLSERAALVQQAEAVVQGLAAQRDGIGGWPEPVQQAFIELEAEHQQLRQAHAQGNARQARMHHAAFMRLAARIARWLQAHHAPEPDAPTAAQLRARHARLLTHLQHLRALAQEHDLTPDPSAVRSAKRNAARAFEQGTPVQQRDALRALRDAIEQLQDALADAARESL